VIGQEEEESDMKRSKFTAKANKPTTSPRAHQISDDSDEEELEWNQSGSDYSAEGEEATVEVPKPQPKVLELVVGSDGSRFKALSFAVSGTSSALGRERVALTWRFAPSDLNDWTQKYQNQLKLLAPASTPRGGDGTFGVGVDDLLYLGHESSGESGLYLTAHSLALSSGVPTSHQWNRPGAPTAKPVPAQGGIGGYGGRLVAHKVQNPPLLPSKVKSEEQSEASGEQSTSLTNQQSHLAQTKVLLSQPSPFVSLLAYEFNHSFGLILNVSNSANSS